MPSLWGIVVCICVLFIQFFTCAKQITGSRELTIDSVSSSLTRNVNNKLEFARLFEQTYHAEDLPPVVKYTDIKHAIPYDHEANKSFLKTTTHIGQRKLFLTELQFLTDVVGKSEKITVIYAGAAPSNHTGFLSDLFPNIKFVLIDPNPFNVFDATCVTLYNGKGAQPNQDQAVQMMQQVNDSPQRIYIINGLMTEEIARAVGHVIPNHLFVSDIRTSLEGTMPDSVDILWNLAQQYNWMCTMKPKHSMLKFRHPYYNDSPDVFRKLVLEEPYASEFARARANGIDFIANFETQTLEYWDGDINIQAFAGVSSTETRLVTTGKNTKIYPPHAEYEAHLFYYNCVDRCYGLHHNPNADQKLGFDRCGDCALENHLWCNYLDKKFTKQNNVRALVAKLSLNTHRPLRRDNHGWLYDRWSPKNIMSALNAHRAGRENIGRMLVKN